MGMGTVGWAQPLSGPAPGRGWEGGERVFGYRRAPDSPRGPETGDPSASLAIRY